jgi:hypothetical protein
MPTTVFLSWQSDRPSREGRQFIEEALRSALKKINLDFQVEEPEREPLQFDKDTKNVPGSPPIAETILRKIDRAAIFVPDLTSVAERSNGGLIPNPNVLIEYGYALKTLGPHRIVAVMNEAYGAPSRESLPFDLGHQRFPITYSLPESAPGAERKSQLDVLAKTFDSAIRAVLGSEEYKASLPKPNPAPVPTYRKPQHGEARFRTTTQPIGFSSDPFPRFVGQTDAPIFLAGGPAFWFRICPQKALQQKLKQSELEQRSLQLVLLPLFNWSTNATRLRYSDGIGWCMPPDKGHTGAVVFVFTDGELWIVDTFALSATPQLIPLDEQAFVKTFEDTVDFLENRLEIPPPYRWIAGMESVGGRSLPIPNNRFGLARGPCAEELIQYEGTYDGSQSASALLTPFFENVFEMCGAARPATAQPV